MSYSMTHYSTAIFGSQKLLGRTAGLLRTNCMWVQRVVVEHTAQTIFIYASKTLDAESD